MSNHKHEFEKDYDYKKLRLRWSDKILSFEGIKDFPSFESYRKDLNKSEEDPL